MNNKKATLVVILMAVLCASVFAQQYDSESDYHVRRNGNEITITGYVGSKPVASIPPKIQDLPVTCIDTFAFINKKNVMRIILPESILTLKKFAFWGCGIINIAIPKNVTLIEGGAFACCLDLASINAVANNREYASIDGVLYNKSKTMLHTYPAGRRGAQYYTPLFSLTDIGDFAFAGNKNYIDIHIHDKITYIGKGAFLYCDYFEIFVDEGNMMYTVQDGVLYNKDITFLHTYLSGGYRSFVVPDSVVKIGGYAFYDKRVDNLTIAGSVTSIESDAFSRGRFNEVTFKGTIPSGGIAYDAFDEVGDLITKFYATDKNKGTPGTYKRDKSVWTRQ